MPVVSCDNCGYLFPFKEAKLNSQDVDVGNGKKIQVRYFVCPKCDEIYKYSYKDVKVEEMIDNIRFSKQELEKAVSEKNDRRIKVLNEVINVRQNELRKYMSILESTYGRRIIYENGKLIYRNKKNRN